MALRGSGRVLFFGVSVAASALGLVSGSGEAIAQSQLAELQFAQQQFAQNSQSVSEPMQLAPRALRSRVPANPDAPPSSSSDIAEPAESAADPPPMPEINLRELAIPGQIMPGSTLRGGGATVYNQGYARRHRAQLRSGQMARQVFRPNILNGRGNGFFMVDPNGVIYLLPVTAEKLERQSIRAEVRVLALAIRLRLRREKILRLRKNYHERMRARNEARLQQSGGKRRLSEFFSDTSLQAEDVVATDGGLFVFRGTQDFPYTRKDFVPLAQWRKAGAGGTRNKLNALQREMRRSR